jgi:uroporphyrinogen decarboxylase
MMGMNSEERILKTLRHEETDRIPVFEWRIDARVIDGLNPGMSNEEFVKARGLDAVCVHPDYAGEELETGLYRDEWGIVKKSGGSGHYDPTLAPIKNRTDLNRYIPPDPRSPARFASLCRVLEKSGPEKALILHLSDVLSIPQKLMGSQEFLVAFWEEPVLAEGLVDMSVEINLALAGEAVKRGIRIIYTGDNYACNSGPLMSADNFRKYLYPGLRKLVKGFKELGLYVIKHTNGNIMPIVDMVVDSGIDCLGPIDPMAGMSLALMKQRYGRRIALKGNVDSMRTLAFGTREDVIRETRRCIETGGPGGGYILSSSGSIHAAVRSENFAAMLETHKAYGNY